MHKKLTIILLFFSCLANAQLKWGLEECIIYAQTHNLSLMQQELSLEIQEKNVLQSKAELLPSINANGSEVVNWGQTVDRYTNEFANTQVSSINLYLQSSITLFSGFQLLNSVKQNIYEMNA